MQATIKMRLKTFTVIIILSCKCLFAFCQSISGRVISSTDKQPVSNVSVSLAGKDIGTVTNEDGKFILVAGLTPADSLSVSYIGYKTKKISLTGTNRNGMIILLDTLVEQLKEVSIRPLSVKELLDSIVRHNQWAFLSPMKLNGYYREFAYTSDKCTEYSDALCSYFRGADRSAEEGQLKITASRCAKAKADDKAPNREYYIDSKLSPNTAFQYALLSTMIAKYFPVDDLAGYDYTMEQSTERSADWIITIFPKQDAADKLHQIVFNLSDDFTLRSYNLEIPANRIQASPQKNFFGLHGKLTKLNFEVDYEHLGTKIYPKFFRIDYTNHLWGKILGKVVEQTDEFKSEYVTTDINTTDLKPFAHGEVYKKGNICGNGADMNDALLKEHNFIAPTKKDSLAISALN